MTDLLYDVIWALMYCVALRLSPCDVTQASWRPPCGVRRVIQKRSQLYTKKSNVSRKILYGLSMSSSPNLNIHLLWVFFSFKPYSFYTFHTFHILLCTLLLCFFTANYDQKYKTLSTPNLRTTRGTRCAGGPGHSRTPQKSNLFKSFLVNFGLCWWIFYIFDHLIRIWTHTHQKCYFDITKNLHPSQK